MLLQMPINTGDATNKILDHAANVTPFNAFGYSLVVLLLLVLACHFAYALYKERAFSRKRDDAALGLAEKVANIAYGLERINSMQERFIKMEIELTAMKEEMTRNSTATNISIQKVGRSIELLIEKLSK